MQHTSVKSIVGRLVIVLIGTCVTVVSFKGVHASTNECIPTSYETLDEKQKEVVTKMIEKIDTMISKNPTLAEKIMNVFEKLGANESMTDAQKAIVTVLYEYYKAMVDGQCGTEASTEISLWKALMQGLNDGEKETDTSGKKRKEKGIGWGSGGTSGSGAALCNDGEKPAVGRGCKVVPVKNEADTCIELKVVCDTTPGTGTGSSGTGETSSCTDVPKPAAKEGCDIKPVKGRKGCIASYEYVCKQAKTCREPRIPTPRTGCTVEKVTTEQGCASYKMVCGSTDGDDEDEKEDNDDEDGEIE